MASSRSCANRTTPRTFIQAIAEDAAVLAEDGKLRLPSRETTRAPRPFDPNLVRQLLFNLISNAVSIMPEDGAFTLASFRAGDRWRIEVRDEGPGLPEDRKLERVFELLYPSPRLNGVPDNSGYGLGLAISRGIARLHAATSGRAIARTGAGW